MLNPVHRSVVPKTDPPRLVVEVVIDQFPEYNLEGSSELGIKSRKPLLGSDGLTKIITNGSYFTNAHCVQALTFTAPGHATIATGAPPRVHGIPNNDWRSRESGQFVGAVADSKTKLLGGTENAPGASPQRLLAQTLADSLVSADPLSKAVVVAGKDRSAILSAGRKPVQTYWLDSATANIASSTAYFDELPAWVGAFNQKKIPDSYFGQSWERLLPAELYQGIDDAPWENDPKLPWTIFGPVDKNRRTFPYVIDGGSQKPDKAFYSQFESTPFANEFLLKFAMEAIRNENLGADEHPDLLVMGFSAGDLIGHAFGPASHEAQDMIARVDRQLEVLMHYLDEVVGPNQWTLCVTADHGVALVPEDAKARGIEGGRIEGGAIAKAVKDALNEKFGEDKWIIEYNRRGTNVEFVHSNLYFNPETIEKHNLNPAEVQAVAAKAAATVEGIHSAYTRTELMAGDISDPVGRSAANSYVAKENGDIIVIAKPNYIVAEPIVGSHGTPWDYDSHVPILFYGKGVGRKLSSTPCSPADIAPTLAKMMGIPAPKQSEGNVLSDALKD